MQLLSKDLPATRIFLFGYNSSVSLQAAASDIRDHANSLLARLWSSRMKETEKDRPIIFICHSLGGILIKQALVTAKLHDAYGDIQKSTVGIIFFGAPHGGGNNVTFGKCLASIFSLTTGQARNSLLDTLKKDSLINEYITDDFRPEQGRLKVVSFFEQEKTRLKIAGWRVMPASTVSSLLPRKKYCANCLQWIVRKSSARLGAPDEIFLGLSGNHSSICKFTTKDRDDYNRYVLARLQDWLRNTLVGEEVKQSFQSTKG